METTKKTFINNPVLNTRVKSANVKLTEILFGYFLGPFGALLSSGIFGAILNKYWTDVLFLGEMTDSIRAFLTLLPLLSVILVVIGNLVVGQLLERTKTMQGKARPYILLSAFVISTASVLMFIVPFSNPVGKMIWLGISYNLYYAVAFPIYNTANSTLIPVSTRNMKQRGLLASAINMSGLAVMGAGAMVFPIIASMVLLDSKLLWFIAILAVAVFAFLACLLQFFFTRERVTEESTKLNIEKNKISIRKQLNAVATDSKWWFIIIFWLLFQLGGMVQNVSMPFFSQWIVDASFWGVDNDWGLTQMLLGIVGAIPMAVAVVLVWPLSNKFGKKNVTVIGLIIGSVGGIIAGLFPQSMVFVAIGIALQCLGAAPACYMILAMIADDLDHLEAKNGFRCDGLTMSIYSLIGAATTGIAMAVFNGLIGAGGYDKLLPVQSAFTNNAITISYIWVRTIAFVIGAVLLLFFTVEKGLEAEHKTITERQKAEVLAAGGKWIDPAERLRIEQEEEDAKAEEARKEELKAYCAKKGLSYEAEEAKYQAKHGKK